MLFLRTSEDCLFYVFIDPTIIKVWTQMQKCTGNRFKENEIEGGTTFVLQYDKKFSITAKLPTFGPLSVFFVARSLVCKL